MATISELQYPFLGSALKNTPYFSFASLVKWFLQSTMWVLFLSWVALFFLVPSDFGAQLYNNWVASTGTTIFGETGSALLIYNGPIFIVALLAIPYLAVSRIELDQQNYHGNGTPRFRLWTFPVLVDGPLGIVSAAELIGIFIFLVFVLWAAYSYTMINIELLPTYGSLTPEERRVQLLQMSAYCFGLIALSIMAFLFLPVARGSILLRLVDIPFEHATRYHALLGHLTMFLLTLHGLGYVLVWIIRGTLLSSIVEWKSDTGANFAGVISYAFGLLIWVTTLPVVKKRCFELFFYTHQLYVMFIVFFALHVGDTVFSKAIEGIFLFMLDRFLRFCQSRRAVNIISATIFPCGSLKLVLSKPSNMQYSALSFIFLKVGEISWLQWHPFSVSSSPLDGKCHISILVKAVGSWTSRLKQNVSNALAAESHMEIPFLPYSRISAFVEGPYGHELPYYLRYKNLILVAGGSGISPFFAILSDVFNRVKGGGPAFPRNILIVWAVKRSSQTTLLSDLEAIIPPLSHELSVEIQTFVTLEPGPVLEGGEVLKVKSYSVSSSTEEGSISVLVGTGNKIWCGAYVFASSIGFVICLGILDAYYINPFNISSRWYKGLMVLACMAASVFIFGGPVVVMWYYCGKKSLANEGSQKNGTVSSKMIPLETLTSLSTIQYGYRPDFKEIFEERSECWAGTDICVIVCGPSALQSSVARECRSRSLGRRRNGSIFHYNSHNFNF